MTDYPDFLKSTKDILSSMAMDQCALQNINERIESFCKVIKQSVWSLGGHGIISSDQGLSICLELLIKAKEKKASVYVIGNGGSAAVASHIVNDFVNQAALKALTLHDAALLTCMANDYGFEHCYANVLKKIASADDILIAISSSGQSKDIINASAAMHDSGGQVITLSGFQDQNPLRLLGDANVWLNSSNYGEVEIGHLFWLHAIADELGRLNE